MEIIISHSSADFDALASMIAAKKLYPSAKLYFTGAPDRNVRDFLVLYRDFFDIEYPKEIKKLEISKLIIVDTSIPSRLGVFREYVNSPQIEVCIYDHHPPTHEAVIGDINKIEPLGATITILLKEIVKKKIPISSMEATLFLIGIYEETGSLTYTTTTKEDVDAVSFLLSKGANLKLISDFVYHSLGEEQRNLLNKLILHSKVYDFKGYQILIATTATKEYVGELALITHRIMDIQKMDAVFSIVAMKDRIYIVARSREGIDVNSILKELGGGGHSTAASATLKTVDYKKTEQELIKIVKKNIHSIIKAADIMSSPVRYINIEEESTIQDAQNAIMKFGHNGLVVKRGTKLLGIITRKDIDKAIHHGLGTSPVEAIMTHKVITATKDSSISSLQKLMMDNDIGRIPVIEKQKVIGIVTRTDILKILHEKKIKISAKISDSIKHLNNLPSDLQKILRICGKVADETGVDIYLVGGFVRDLIIGVENLDVDIVVEGDGIKYAEKLAKTLKGRVKTHEKFKTAVVIAKKFKIDIASSRIEFYTRPAALPTVWGSSLKQDLYRRDFTINAMAVKLNKKEYGQVIDFFGGQQDIKKRVIRVLHNLSFIEDPTRILRAIRFEQRYCFKMDTRTEKLLEDALSIKILDQVTNERLRNELILILNEPKPLLALKRMQQLKMLKLIHPQLILNSKIIAIIEEITVLLLTYSDFLKKEKIEQWIVFFMALISQLKLSQIQEIANKYKISAIQMKKLDFDRVMVSQIIKNLMTEEMKPSQIYRELEILSTEAIIYLMARSKLQTLKQRIKDYLFKYRYTKFLIKGKDLKKWGYIEGPFYRRALRFLEDAQLDGIIKNKEEAELSLEKKYGKKYQTS